MPASLDGARADDGFAIVRGGDTLLALDVRHGRRPAFLYAGPDFGSADPKELALLATMQHLAGGPEHPRTASLANEIGVAPAGGAGLIAQRSGLDWHADLRVTNVTRLGDHEIEIDCRDERTGIAATHSLSIDLRTGVLACATSLENVGEQDLEVDWCASICIPLDARLTRLTGFAGRWSGEFQMEEVDLFRGSYLRENRDGRTSHGSFPGLILRMPGTCEDQGLAAAFHLAWSGNHRLRVDQGADGRAFLQMGDLPFPGEIRLARGETYRTPDLLACWSNRGIGPLSLKLRDFLEDRILDGRSQGRPRPVHYNTWEAVYFNHDPQVMLDLAERAAAVGAERFVLDDGWFGGRRNDRTGLGDWWVSRDAYPDGLHPIVEKVRSLGMEFGLWFEPEMVNPDSDLYRQHPDWVLEAEAPDDASFRNQLTLDLTMPEVREYLFEKIDALVQDYAIDYIKWDMNRDTYRPESGGRAAMSSQTRSVYSLLERLRACHPSLEIESCASGGGRADFGIMAHADRIWTSDNNDARDRQVIQRGASHFFPLKILGSHVGPERCHVTGRRLSMAFRVATAMFGHMGLELDLRAVSAADLEVLAAGIALYKKHRSLIHEGSFLRLASPESTNLIGCVSPSRDDALFSYAILDTQAHHLPAPLVLRGLDPDKNYRVRMIWPIDNPSLSSPSIIDEAGLMAEGSVFAGAALMNFGIRPPLVHPDTCLVYHLEAE